MGPNREGAASEMAVYAATVDRMDQSIGRPDAALKPLGQVDDRLILFLSDKGGCADTWCCACPAVICGPAAATDNLAGPEVFQCYRSLRVLDAVIDSFSGCGGLVLGLRTARCTMNVAWF